MSRRPAVALLAVLVLAACDRGGPAVEPPDATASPVDASPAAPPDDEPSGEASPSPASSPADLAGEPYDGPPLGGFPASLDVIGVAAGDVLNVRSGPGVAADVVATLAPLATDVAATGAARLLPGSIWLEVEVDGATGWANSSFFAFLGSTDDVTSQLLEDDQQRPRAATMEELGELVAARVASQEPASRIVISDGPSVGDLAEVTVDVVGLGDDATAGLRLVVFATVDPDGFTLRTVERTVLCGRGVTDDGICV